MKQNRGTVSYLIPLLIFCCFLGGCQTAKQEDAQAFKSINDWKGQNIQFAIDRLGQPDKVTTGKKGHFYFWYNAREINTQLTGNTLNAATGHTLQDPNAKRYNKEVTCRIRLFTGFDNTILHYRFGGNTLACRDLAEKVNASDEDTGDVDSSTWDTKNSGKDSTGNPAPPR